MLVGSDKCGRKKYQEESGVHEPTFLVYRVDRLVGVDNKCKYILVKLVRHIVAP